MSDPLQRTRRRAAVLIGLPARTAKAEKSPLGPLERMFVRLADGSRSIEVVAGLLELTTREAASLTLRLVDLGVIEMREGPGQLDIDLDESFDESIQPSSAKDTERTRED